MVTLLPTLILQAQNADPDSSRATRDTTATSKPKVMNIREYFHVLKYDIAANRITNSYSNLLPEEGMTFEEFTARIHPKEQEEFRLRTGRLQSGRDRKFELVKRWNAGTAEHPQWHRFQGHAIVELDKNGHPQYVINAINTRSTSTFNSFW